MHLPYVFSHLLNISHSTFNQPTHQQRHIEATHSHRLAHFNLWHLNLSSHYRFFNESINQLIIIKLASNKRRSSEKGHAGIHFFGSCALVLSSPLLPQPPGITVIQIFHVSPCTPSSHVSSREYRLKKSDNYMIIFHPPLLARWLLLVLWFCWPSSSAMLEFEFGRGSSKGNSCENAAGAVRLLLAVFISFLTDDLWYNIRHKLSEGTHNNIIAVVFINIRRGRS